MLLNTSNLVIIFFAVIGGFIVLLFGLKFIYRFRFHKKYNIFPRINNEGISNTAMVIAICVSIILLLTFLSAGVLGIFFRIYPGWRATIEGILIKLGGLLFGPIIGIFIGVITDLLTVALTAGMFHYGFFLIAIAYGFLAGICRIIINKTKNNLLLCMTYITVLSIVSSVLISWYINSAFNVYTLSILSKEVVMTNWQVVSIFAAIEGSSLLFCWLFFIFFHYKRLIFYFKHYRYYSLLKKKTHLINKIKNPNKANTHNEYAYEMLLLDKKIRSIEPPTKHFKAISYSVSSFLHVFLLIAICEPVIEVVMMPVFDVELGGGIPLDYWIVFRLFFSIVIILINFFIVYPIYHSTRSLMRYDYRSGIITKRIVKK